jgi:GTP-binding protein
MSQKTPIVAIVGRANVGKSSLFNALLSQREAIVAREAGTTRDSITAKARYKDRSFWLVDTAGIKDPEDSFEFTIQEQIVQAIDNADVIIIVVEASVPITEEDRGVAKLALKSHKPVCLVVNKVDTVKDRYTLGFERLGIKSLVFTSTTQKKGIEELLGLITDRFPKNQIITRDENNRLHLALIGRPNVGKSHLFNALARKQQAIVSERAGTTRDVNRLSIRFNGQEIELADTAGIRRSGKIQPGVERFSVIRAMNAIEQADICLLLMDVNELNVQLDQKIAGLVKSNGKGLILVLSKWDTLKDKRTSTRDELARQIAVTFGFVPWAPLILTSAVTGQNVTKLLEVACEIDKHRHTKLTTSELNRWLQEAIANHPPAGSGQHLPKLNYMVQESDNPTPSFKIFGSQTRFVHWSYRRYLERSLREHFEFSGTPIKLWLIEKHETHPHGRRPA